MTQALDAGNIDWFEIAGGSRRNPAPFMAAICDRPARSA
jgi:hypothetical protein